MLCARAKGPHVELGGGRDGVGVAGAVGDAHAAGGGVLPAAEMKDARRRWEVQFGCGQRAVRVCFDT